MIVGFDMEQQSGSNSISCEILRDKTCMTEKDTITVDSLDTCAHFLSLTFQSNFPVSKSNTRTPRSRPPTANLHSPLPPELSIAILVAILTLAYRPLVYVNVPIEFELFLDELGVGNLLPLVDVDEVSISKAL